ncbi:hypothetical protein FHW88_003765 [Mucilaginibacter sp. SG538B]|nr:hypothetical protein [Mucilaginibacter sp. SG538B]SCW57478.1 hypothetical protein SAMN03159284_02049 [Mucilaginibacter sp. NFR10]
MNKTLKNKKYAFPKALYLPLFFGDFWVVFLIFSLKSKIDRKVLTEQSHQKMRLI